MVGYGKVSSWPAGMRVAVCFLKLVNATLRRHQAVNKAILRGQPRAQSNLVSCFWGQGTSLGGPRKQPERVPEGTRAGSGSVSDTEYFGT